MVTNPKIGVSRFVFLKLPRAKVKMDIFGGHKNVQFWGVKNVQFWGQNRPILGGQKCPILGGQKRLPPAFNHKYKFPIFKRNIFGEKVVQTYTLDLISLKV